MSWLFTLWSYRKAVGAGLLVLALSYLVWDYGRDHYSDGYAKGTAEVQARWDAEVQARDLEVARATAEREARDKATRARNEEVIHGYQEQISRIAGDRDSLARRLRDSEARSNTVPTATDQQGTADATAKPESARSVDEALDGYDQACRQDAAQLEALIEQVSEQLDTSRNPG
jgi:hypothetical protein